MITYVYSLINKLHTIADIAVTSTLKRNKMNFFVILINNYFTKTPTQATTKKKGIAKQLYDCQHRSLQLLLNKNIF